MEVEMILLNLTEEILEKAKQEGREVVEVEMTPTKGVEEVAVEADLIQQAAQTRPTKGHYRTR
jgi:S-adenosylmethionine:tRNA-ribosyltransferase-isomerase (queuine synthetase)